MKALTANMSVRTSRKDRYLEVEVTVELVPVHNAYNILQRA